MPAEEIKSESAKKNEDWMNSKWRPAMGWMYMAVCMADFVAFPILWSLVQVLGDGKVETQWSPITLQGRIWSHTRENGRSQQWRYNCNTSACCGRTSSKFRRTRASTCAHIWSTCT
jgi:hypothetical protein